MSSGNYTITTRAVGAVLTATIYNADHQNHVTNQNPQGTGAYSDTVGQMQTMRSPGSVGGEALATSLADEIASIRYILQKLSGAAQWYAAPLTSLGALFGSGTATKSASYTLTQADNGQSFILNAGSAQNLTMLAPATFGNGNWFRAINIGTAAWTLLPAAAETFDSAGSKLVIDPGESFWIMTDGTNWFTVSNTLGAQRMDLEGHGQLVYTDTTHVTLNRYNGCTVPVKANGLWQARQIPSAGIAALSSSTYVNGTAAQALAASTVYYVAVFDNAGVLTLDFLSSATRATDATTGISTKSGDATRTIVGMVKTNGSSQFVTSGSQAFVISYYNRRSLECGNAITADFTSTSTSFVELNTSTGRAEFLAWSDEVVTALMTGPVQDASGTDLIFSALGFDSTTAERGAHYINAPSSTLQVGASVQVYKSGLSEGYHYATMLGRTSLGTTGTWRGHASAPEARCCVQVMVRG